MPHEGGWSALDFAVWIFQKTAPIDGTKLKLARGSRYVRTARAMPRGSAVWRDFRHELFLLVLGSAVACVFAFLLGDLIFTVVFATLVGLALAIWLERTIRDY
jgi:hypothetical protein